MCGFIAIYSPIINNFDPQLLENMTNQLAHRGPDDYGFAFIGPEQQHFWHADTPAPINSSGVAMGHRRLSIIDLSVAGRQPFYSADKRYWMVYNGEVYNYRELRDELQGLGYQFQTSTDTEVVLNAYRQWGHKCLQKFNGMWAIIIWDNKTKTLFATRDRLGIKPLYYYKQGETWYFASEIKAFFKNPAILAKPDMHKVFNFVWLERQVEGNETFFKDIYALPAASFLEIRENHAKEEKYWALPEYTGNIQMSHEEKCEQFLNLLRDSIRLRLRSDVKIGTMLSGGLDSTSIACMINEQLAGNTDSTITDVQQAISASFPNLWNDETEKVDELGNALNLKIDKVFPIKEDVKGQLEKVVYGMEIPFCGSMPNVQYMLMHRAKEKGITVTLNGHGPDEMVAGYPLRYCSLVAVEYLTKLDLKRFYSEFKAMKALHGIGISDLVYSFLFNNVPVFGNFIRDTFRSSKKKYFKKNVFDDLKSRPFRSFDRTSGGKTALDRRLRREFFNEVLPYELHCEDRMSMSAAVESRVPFLDYRLVEFSFGLNDSDKINNGVTKFILRNAMKNYLPSSIRSDNKKLFFNGDVLTWMQNDLKPIINHLLLNDTPFISSFMDADQYRPLVNRVIDNNDFDDWDERLVWRMLITEIWMRLFFK